MKFILGKKIAMTQVWQGDLAVPVTQVQAGPCVILQQKTADKDGYTAVQLGFGDRRAKLISKPQRGHFKTNGNFRFVREFRVPTGDQSADLTVGGKITVATFKPGDKLTVVGESKGKGFQGVVKRHGFHGQDATHGNKDQLRASGSVGAGGVQHVFKGTRMGGRTGGDRVTLHDVEIIAVDEATNSIFVRGGLPGARNSLVLLSGEGELVVNIESPSATEAASEDKPATEENQDGQTTDTTEEAAENTDTAAETPAEEKKSEEAPAEEPAAETKEA